MILDNWGFQESLVLPCIPGSFYLPPLITPFHGTGTAPFLFLMMERGGGTPEKALIPSPQ
jgi:hypothetical protein